MRDSPYNGGEYFEYREYMKKLGGDNNGDMERLIENLNRAIREEISPKQWEAMKLYYVKQMKMIDIADYLGVNVSTVSRNIRRGKAKLGKCLKYGAKALLDN